jgi:hypothetical protein
LANVRIVSWNIKWGGQDRGPLIAKTLRECSPDVVVLSEYQPGVSDELLRLLKDAGLGHSHVTHPPSRRGGVAVVSRHPLEVQPTPAALVPFAWRQATVSIPALNIDVWGLYGPLQEEPYCRVALGEVLLLACRTGVRDVGSLDARSRTPSLTSSPQARQSRLGVVSHPELAGSSR